MVRKAILLTLLSAFSFADTGFKDTIRVTETDLSPSCMAGQIKVSPGTLTCNGQTATITTGGGGGGGAATLPLPGGATNYWNYPSSGTFVAGQGITASTGVFTSSLNVTGLLSGTTIQMSSGSIAGLLTVSSSVFVGDGTVGKKLIAYGGENSVISTIIEVRNIGTSGTGTGSRIYFTEGASGQFEQGSLEFVDNGASGETFDLWLTPNGLSANRRKVLTVGGGNSAPSFGFGENASDTAASFNFSRGSIAGVQSLPLFRITSNDTNDTGDIFQLIRGDNTTKLLTVGSLGAVTVASSATFNGTVGISSGLIASNSAGSSGQFLTSGGAGTIPTWTTASGTGDMILASTQTITGGKTSTSSTTFAGTVVVSSNVVLNGAQGTSGQVFTTGVGGAPTWTTPAAGGGSSTLAVTTGTATGWTGVPTSSPTAVINASSTTFMVTLRGGATAFLELNSSSVTLQANTFNGATQLVQTNAFSFVPLAVIDGSSVTKLGPDIDLTGAEVTGQLKAASFPILTGAITTAGGSLTTTANALQPNITTFTSSITVTNFFTAKSTATFESEVRVGTISFNSGMYYSGARVVTTTTTLTGSDSVIFASAALNAGRITFTLPAANTRLGQSILIAKVDRSSAIIRVESAGTDMIQSTRAVNMFAPGQKIKLISDGLTKWYADGPLPYQTAFLGNIAEPNSAAGTAISSNTHYCPLTVTEPVFATGIRYDVGATGVNGRIDVAIMDIYGTRLANSGSVLVAGTGLRTTAFTTAIGLLPGIYYYALTFNTVAVTLTRFGTGGSNLGCAVEAGTSGTAPTTGVLTGVGTAVRQFSASVVLAGGGAL